MSAVAGPELSFEAYRLLRELVYEHCGLAFADDQLSHFQRRLRARLAFHGLASFAAYHRFLRFDPGRRAELELAAELLTTNETYLFRDPRQLRAFSEEIVPALARENAAERRMRVWSAGCSTGEEAYTLAALLLQSSALQGFKLEVFGSDLARRALAVARAGAYGPRAFRSPEAEALRPFFREEGGRWHASEALKRMVGFGHQNLLDPEAAAFLGPADVVLCRNVMIYFDLAARRRVARTFFDALRPGGWLLVGHAESLLQVTADFELVQLRHDLAYRKPRAP